jgi:hypothetical protein
MTLQQWLEIVNLSLQNLWLRVAGFAPELLGAVVVLIIGLIVASGLDKITERVVYYLKIDALLRKLEVETYLHRANLELDSGHFLGKIVYWFMVIVFVLAASDILGFSALSVFLGAVLMYIPQVVVAFLILLATVIVAGFLKKFVEASVLSARLHAAKFIGSLVWWSVFVFGLLTAVHQLGVATDIISTVITGLIFMLALAGGLAFGLGGKDEAASVLKKLRGEWEHRR